MSGEPKRERKSSADDAERQSHIELMREMGATEYDPLMPDQYLFRLDPAMKLSSVAQQLHAWLLWMTVHLHKPGGRTAFAAWADRPLGLKDAAHDLGHDLPAISKAWRELEEKRVARRDEKKRLYPCGKVNFKRLTHRESAKKLNGEEKVKLFVQTTYAPYIAKRLEQLSESERNSFIARHARVEQAEDEAIAEVTAQVRASFAPVRKALLATIAVKPRELEKRRHKTERRVPELKVSLQLELPKFEFVQTTSEQQNGHSVQSEKPGLHKPENGSAQTPHPYRTEKSEKSEKNPSPTPSLPEGGAAKHPSEKPSFEEQETGNEQQWQTFFVEAQSLGMECTDAEYPQRRKQFLKLPLEKRIAATGGLHERIAIGQYDPGRPQAIPSLRNYLFAELWTAPKRPPLSKKSTPDTSVLDLLEQGVPEEEALRIIEERNGNKKTSKSDRAFAKGAGNAG